MHNFSGLNNFKFLKQHKIGTENIIHCAIIHYPFRLSIQIIHSALQLLQNHRRIPFPCMPCFIMHDVGVVISILVFFDA